MELKVVANSGCLPSRATSGSAGFDLVCSFDNGGNLEVGAGDIASVPTGVKVAIPEGYVGLLFIRSSLGSKGLTLANSVGVIDSDYRGEIFLKVLNNSKNTFSLENGSRVAQLVLVPALHIDVTEVDSLDQTARGEGGFGSTGQ